MDSEPTTTRKARFGTATVLLGLLAGLLVVPGSTADVASGETGYCTLIVDGEPNTAGCVVAAADAVCNFVVVHSGTPQPGVWDPLLGLIEFHPDNCVQGTYGFYVRVTEADPYYGVVWNIGDGYVCPSVLVYNC